MIHPEYCRFDPQVHELCVAIERLGCGEGQTRASVLASALHVRVCKDKELIAALEWLLEVQELAFAPNHWPYRFVTVRFVDGVYAQQLTSPGQEFKAIYEAALAAVEAAR